MTPESHDQWASTSATRLRTLQSSSANLPAARRREYLREELRKTMEELPAGERIAKLERLAEQFPVEQEALPGDAAPSAPAPEHALTLLAQVMQDLEGPARDSFLVEARALLGESGSAPSAPAGESLPDLLTCSEENRPHLQLALTVLKSGKLDIRSPGPLDLLNLVKTAALLIDSFGGLEAVFWKIWSAASPKSKLQEPFDHGYFPETARLLEGVPGASFADYSRDVTQTSHLLVAVLSALPTALERLSGEWLDKFAPERIAAHVRSTDSAPFGGPAEQRYWREYEYRAADFTSARLAETFFRHLSDTAGAMIQSQ